MIESALTTPISDANPRADAFSSNSSSSSSNTMGMEDFLQLLTTQIANQDPLEPMKDTEFISQMANVASLENQQKFTQSFTEFAESQNQVATQAYLGRKVTIETNSGERKSSVAEAVERSADGQITVTVDGKAYPIANIVRVELVDKSVSK
jgi:flagellar basal-body rod modification protein FlgD